VWLHMTGAGAIGPAKPLPATTSDACGTFHRRRTGALYRTPPEEADCRDGAALQKGKESKDV
jgi:hypothetical protein